MSHVPNPTTPPSPRRLAVGVAACLALLAALSGSATTSATAQDCFDYSTSMHWIGGLRYPADGTDIALAGNVAFLTTSAPSLIALDVSDPTSPVLLGDVTAPSIPVSLAIQGNYAYVSCGSAGVQVFDISNPSAMQLVGGVAPAGVADGITISGAKAYVAYRTSGLYIFDLANPTAPSLLGTLDTPGDARDVAVVGTRAYVADTNSGLRVVNVANPAAPVSLGWVDTPSKAVAVRVAGNLAYVGDTFSLQIADVANPAAPSIVGAVLTQGTAACLALAGTDVFLSGTDCIKAVDAANPAAPVVTGSMPDGRDIASIALLGDIAFVAKGGDMPFSAFDVSSRSTPNPLAVYQPGGTVNTLQVEGNFGYLGLDPSASSAGFRVLDLSNPLAPAQVGSLAVLNVIDIAIDGSRAFALSNVGGGRLVSINISDPAHPAQYQSITPPEFIQCIAVDGPYAYLGAWSGNLLVADVSNPSAMSIVATIPVSLRNLDIVVSGHYVYLAGSSHGVYVVDVADPLHPVVVANVPGSLAEGVALSGNYLLRSLWGSGFGIEDVSDPTAPVTLSRLNGAAWANATTIDGSTAYMVGDANPGGLWVVDFANPAAPKVVGSASLPATSDEVTVARGVVYVSCGTQGLVIMPTACPLSAAAVGGGYEASAKLRLSACSPNPTHGGASLRLSLARPAEVSSTVFDATGRTVRVLLSSSLLPSGASELTWDGRDSDGRPAAQGVYFVRVVAGGESAESKLTLIR
ncbi:MAG: FlgD immunoglobulin-like domain containing protein [Candidatus Eisenbacteria bacterium]